MKPIVVTLNVPGIDVPHGTCTLQIGYWNDSPYGRASEGECGEDHLLDNHVYDGEGLTVIGLDEAPETYGSFAAGWLQRQLQRPVERLTRGCSLPPARRCHLDATVQSPLNVGVRDYTGIIEHIFE